MKTALFSLFFVFCFNGFSQIVPKKINYQGAIRTSSGTPIVNQTVGILFEILQGNNNGNVVYAEPQTRSTNALGLFSTQFGGGSNFDNIVWSAGPYFLRVSIDIAGGSAYVALPDPQQLVSVPFALAAGSAPSPTISFDPLTKVLSVGGNTAVIAGSAIGNSSTSIVSSGAITQTLLGNTYTISSPVVSLNAALNPTASPAQALGLAQVTGAYPNYSVMVNPLIAYNPTVGVLSLSSLPLTAPAYNYTYDITPKLTLSGNALTVGPIGNSVNLTNAFPNTSLFISPPGIGTITATGTNSFNINIPATNITGAGVLGTFPNYTVPGSSPQVSITTSGTGGAQVTPSGIVSNSFNISVPALTLIPQGAINLGGAYPVFTMFTPSVTVAANPTVGLAEVSGPFPNWNITVNPSFSYMNSTGSLVVTNPANAALSYSYSVLPLLSYSNNILWSGPVSNSMNITPTITGTGLGAATVTSSANNFSVTVPVVTLTPYNGALAPGTNGGLLSFFGSYPNYSLSVIPQINFSSATGLLVFTNPTTNNTFSYNITPALTVTNNIIQSGPATNTVAILTPSAQVFNVAAGSTVVGTSPTQVSSAMNFTKAAESSEIDVYLHTPVNPGVWILPTTEISFELRIDGQPSPVSTTHYLFVSNQKDYITLRGVFAGLIAGPHTVTIWAKVNSLNASGVQIDPTNNGGKLILKETY
jgi:hypothetical protein